MLSLNSKLNLPFTALNKGGGPSAEVGRSQLLPLFIGGREVPAKQATEAPCAVLENLYAAPHPHAQETAMRHVQDVAKNGPCTSKQTQNNNPTTKQRLHLKPSCAALEISTPRKGKEKLVYKSINQTQSTINPQPQNRPSSFIVNVIWRFNV
jgi:hypothetical protein